MATSSDHTLAEEAQKAALIVLSHEYHSSNGDELHQITNTT